MWKRTKKNNFIYKRKKRIKYLGVNLTKQVKDLYTKTRKHCWKKLSWNKVHGKTPCVHRLKDNFIKVTLLSKWSIKYLSKCHFWGWYWGLNSGFCVWSPGAVSHEPNPSPLCFGCFWNGASCLCPGQPGSWSSYLSFQRRWNDRPVPPHPALFFFNGWDGVSTWDGLELRASWSLSPK